MNSWRKVIVVGLVVLETLVLIGCQSGQDGNTDTQVKGSVATEMQTETELVAESESEKENVSTAETELQTETQLETETESEVVDLHEYDFTICYAGDVRLDDAAYTTERLNNSENGIYGCISPELLAIMQGADIMCLNNEFTFSTNGEPLKGKKYTFRGDPERVSVLVDMGVDVVSLANNHVYDYGKQSMLDTFATLEGAGIEYFGAGETLEEAMRPVYYEIDGKTIALVGASRAEKYKMTPQATDDSPGILRCYDTELFLEVIREADANADFVIAYVHWGTEYSTVLEDAQLTTGKEYLDAGADAIIGAHSHCLQGMEYYNGKPIVYGLGNYWFNKKSRDAMLVQLHFTGNDEGGSLEVEVIPAIQRDAQTLIVTEDKEKERIFDFLEEISVNVEIDENGIMREK